MKSQLTEDTNRGKNVPIQGLFFETDGGVFIMENSFDWRNYNISVSSGYVIIKNMKEGRTYVPHYLSAKEKLGEKENYYSYENLALTCSAIKDIEIGEEISEDGKFGISEGVLFKGSKGILIAKNKIGEIWDMAKMREEMVEKIGEESFWNPSIGKNVIKDFAGNLGGVRKIILGGKQYNGIDLFLEELVNLKNLKTIEIKDFSRKNSWFTGGETDENFYLDKHLEIKLKESETIKDIKNNKIFGHDWKDCIVVLGETGRDGKIIKREEE